MKATVQTALFFIIGLVEVWSDIRVCSIGCLPDDEFQDGETTAEWDGFMDYMTNVTFLENSLQCRQNTSQYVTIDHTSDFVWDLRFQIYSKRQNEEQKTLNDCYCEFTDCQSEELRQCLADARVNMNGEITSFMTVAIGTELRRLSRLC